MLACASTPAPTKEPPQGTLRILNTTDRCLAARDLAITAGAKRLGLMEAGAQREVSVGLGQYRMTAREVAPGGGTHAPPADRVVDVADTKGVAEVVWGCASALNVGPAPVRLVVHPHRCDAGPIGVVNWVMGGQPLAQQRPGTRREVRVRLGHHRVEALVAREVVGQQHVELAEGGPPPQVAVGCSGEPKRSGLLPLTVSYWPVGKCVAPLPARVAGQTLALSPATGFTLYLPPGRHLIAFGDGTTEAVTLRSAGSFVQRTQCIESTSGAADAALQEPTHHASEPTGQGRAKPGKKP